MGQLTEWRPLPEKSAVISYDGSNCGILLREIGSQALGETALSHQMYGVAH